jgi:hypothetical protein
VTARKRAVRVKVRCGQAVKARVTASVRATFRKNKPKARTYRLKAKAKSLKARKTLTVRIVLPKKAIASLRKHAKMTIAFKLVATNKRGRSTVTARTRSVKLHR